MTTVTGVVVDAAGRPAAGVPLELRAQGWSGQVWRAVSGRDGVARFELPPMNARSAGTFTISDPSTASSVSERFGRPLLLRRPAGANASDGLAAQRGQALAATQARRGPAPLAAAAGGDRPAWLQGQCPPKPASYFCNPKNLPDYLASCGCGDNPACVEAVTAKFWAAYDLCVQQLPRGFEDKRRFEHGKPDFQLTPPKTNLGTWATKCLLPPAKKFEACLKPPCPDCPNGLICKPNPRFGIQTNQPPKICCGPETCGPPSAKGKPCLQAKDGCGAACPSCGPGLECLNGICCDTNVSCPQPTVVAGANAVSGLDGCNKPCPGCGAGLQQVGNACCNPNAVVPMAKLETGCDAAGPCARKCGQGLSCKQGMCCGPETCCCRRSKSAQKR